MGYEIIDVNDKHAHEHFLLVIPHASKKLGRELANPHVEKLWVNRLGPHDHLYQADIKTGHLGNHHHFSVLYEVRGKHNEVVNVLNIHEGHKTLF